MPYRSMASFPGRLIRPGTLVLRLLLMSARSPLSGTASNPPFLRGRYFLSVCLSVIDRPGNPFGSRRVFFRWLQGHYCKLTLCFLCRRESRVERVQCWSSSLNVCNCFQMVRKEKVESQECLLCYLTRPPSIPHVNERALRRRKRGCSGLGQIRTSLQWTGGRWGSLKQE